MISPEEDNSHQNNLDNYIAVQVRGEISIFDFGVNCPFKTSKLLKGLLFLHLSFMKLGLETSIPRTSDVFSNSGSGDPFGCVLMDILG